MPASPEEHSSPQTDFRAKIAEIRDRETAPNRSLTLAKGALNLLLLTGGAALVASVLVPTRTAGASRSAFLDWERRDAEIARAAAEQAAPQPPAR